MKAKMSALVALTVIIATLLGGNMAHALDTSATIYLTLRVVRPLSLNLEDAWLQENLERPEAEAFSEVKENGVLVDKLNTEDSTVWLFTKTE